MKKIVVLTCVLFLQGLNAFGETNALPAGQLVSRPEAQKQKAVVKPKAAVAPVAPAQGILSRTSEARPADIAAIHRISREGLLNRPELRMIIGPRSRSCSVPRTPKWATNAFVTR